MDLSKDKDVGVLGNDLSSIMTEFFSLRDRHTEEHKNLVELKCLVHVQKELLRLARQAELCKQQETIQARITIGQQQSIIDSLQGVKEERNKVFQDCNLLRKKGKDTLRQLAAETEVLQKSMATLKLEKSKQLEETKLQGEMNVQSARQETENCRAEFEKTQEEMEETFHSLRAHKNEELNLLTFEYEDKLQKVEENLSVMSAEHDLKIAESQSTIRVLTQRNADPERKLAEAERERQMAANNIPSVSYQNKPQPVNSVGKKSAITTANKTTVQKKQYQAKVRVQSTVKRTVIQPLPFKTNQETNQGKTVTFETKRRKLFSHQDEN